MSPIAPSPAPARLGRVIFVVTAALGCLVAAGPVTTNDLFWHIKTGELLWTGGVFPERDVFSYTATDLPWFLHEWLTQLLFYGLHELGGLTLLRLFTGLMAVAILFVVWRLANRLLPGSTAAVVVLLAFAILATDRFQTRPTLFSMLFFLGFVAWFSGHRGAWRWRDAAIVVFGILIWVNLHSVGLLGLVLYTTFVAGVLTRAWLAREPIAAPGARHGATLLAAAAVTCLNPSGWHLYGFAFQDKGEVMNLIVDEWGAFQLDYGANPALSPEGYGIILATSVIVVITCLATGIALNPEEDRRSSPALPDPVHLGLLFLCLGGGLMAVRFHWMVAITLAFALHHLMALLRHGYLRRIPYARGLRIAGQSCAVALFGLHYHRDLEHEGTAIRTHLASTHYYTRDMAPSLDLSGVRFMREAGLTGNAFCHYASGGMLSYFLYPDIKVFLDSRADLYRRELLLEFLAIRDGRPDQQQLLDRHETDIYYRHWEIAPLRDPSGWSKVYTGEDGEVWLRKHDRNLANLERCKEWHRGFARPGTPR